MAGSLSIWDKFIAESEPHDQIGLLVAAGCIIGMLVASKYALILGVVALILVIGVIVDLTAHGWDH